MSTSNVLKIADYRGRRTHRLRLAESLYSASKCRSALLRHVAEAASITGADRAAIVWVDEYGPGLVHPHVVLDLLADRPRRSFAADSLRRAWELGVPGALDEPAPATGGAPSTLSVALGSDGTRAWFLVTESVGVRASLETAARERIMFLSGECSAIVLHRDLDALVRGDDAAEGDQAGARFAGWPILRDMEGVEADSPESAKISRRFIVARLARMLVDDDLAIPRERMEEQARKARDEIRSIDPDTDREARIWYRFLDAYEAGRMDEVAPVLLEMGQEADRVGHRYSAMELSLCSYEVAAATGGPDSAVESARFHARLHRRQAVWDDARRWYDTARAIAFETGMDDRLARIMSGLALISKDRGNLPAARNGLLEALPIAARSGDPDTLGVIYHDLMAVEALSERLESALEYGWMAVTTYVDETSKLRGLATLGGVLMEAGEHRAAEDAWAVVAHRSDEDYYRIYAWHALSHLAALRGDGGAFDRRCERCDSLGWQTGHDTAAAEIYYERGVACQALERFDAAESWLKRAIEFAEAKGFGAMLFKAEAALQDLRESSEAATPTRQDTVTPEELRLGLREMRVGLVGANVY